MTAYVLESRLDLTSSYRQLWLLVFLLKEFLVNTQIYFGIVLGGASVLVDSLSWSSPEYTHDLLIIQ